MLLYSDCVLLVTAFFNLFLTIQLLKIKNNYRQNHTYTFMYVDKYIYDLNYMEISFKKIMIQTAGVLLNQLEKRLFRWRNFSARVVDIPTAKSSVRISEYTLNITSQFTTVVALTCMPKTITDYVFFKNLSYRSFISDATIGCYISIRW